MSLNRPFTEVKRSRRGEQSERPYREQREQAKRCTYGQDFTRSRIAKRKKASHEVKG